MSCLTAALATIDGGRVLDVGCGAGRFTRRLAVELKSVTTVTGVDPDKESVDEARRETEDRRINYRIMSGEEMVFSDERFDTVAMSHALHHLPDPRRVFAQITRVLRPGGTLVLYEPISDVSSVAQENDRDIHHLKAAIDRVKGLSHRDTYDRNDVRRIVGDLGFEIVIECIEDDTGNQDDSASREALEFISEYLGHIQGTEQYDAIAESVRALTIRIGEHGIDTVPRIVMVCRKPVDRSLR